MKVFQVCIARYHHFNLARELNKHNNLTSFYTGYPRFKFKDEELIPKQKIISVPHLVTPFMFLERYGLWPYRKLRDQFSFLTHQHLDFTVSKDIVEPIILISFCAAGLHSFRKNKKLGGINICDKGSTHIVYQNEIMKEEFLRYGMYPTEIYQRRIEKELREYNEADFITVPSKFVYDSFIKKGISKEKLKLIQYGARISRFKPIKEEILTRRKEFNILFVGNFGPRKGAIDILEAFKKLKHPNKVLTIIGSISKPIKNLINKYDIDKIKIIGTVRNDLLVGYYQNADVFLLPSIEEGSAIVILEAMACGCPVIVSENAGADYVNHGENGFVVPIRSPDIICEYLCKIADDKDLRKKMRTNNLNYVKKINGWSQYGEKWKQLLKSIKKIY